MQAFRASLIIAATLGLAACDLSGGSSARSNAPLVADQLPAIADWAKPYLGQKMLAKFPAKADCEGYVDIVTARYGDGKSGVAVEGWGWDATGKRGTLKVLLVDDKGVITGAADGGRPRPDVPKAMPAVTSETVGWRGYATTVSGEVTAYGLVDQADAACSLGRIQI
ncbi:hypothetical protein G5B46_11585 [Caulobacter sp. 602-2]|uniref:Lipoprotein n=1 Tax=Caulobacter sp. 602-2 TaxID=2710887 RepID=A0A6G4QXI5_9CAUL|nr:hypothetical protein [Caulobacter sp. 602-2]NGM50251.1 hypothetical protein [Caulobacter sp. 602-2]